MLSQLCINKYSLGAGIEIFCLIFLIIEAHLHENIFHTVFGEVFLLAVSSTPWLLLVKILVLGIKQSSCLAKLIRLLIHIYKYAVSE